MSLASENLRRTFGAINVDKVRAVLLADGWHSVVDGGAGSAEISSFAIGFHAYANSDGTEPWQFNEGDRVSPIGFHFTQAGDYPGIISGPLTSILAVRVDR